jgi:hypothetical protein
MRPWNRVARAFLDATKPLHIDSLGIVCGSAGALCAQSPDLTEMSEMASWRQLLSIACCQ